MGACCSSPKEVVLVETNSTRNRAYSFHENLVLQRFGKDRFESTYEIQEEIGRGGLCTIFKIKQRQVERNMGPARRFLKRNSLRSRDKGMLDDSSDTDREEGSDTNFVNKKSTAHFALKVINLALVQEDKIDSLKNEVEILKTLDHKNILKAYETFSYKETRTLEIVMELCTGGDLHARMPYTEISAARVIKQILSAISYVHDRAIIHRDIKFENIMFESTHPEACIKVIDFGLSKKYSMDNPILTERVGTLYSMSPETMQGIYTTKADLWSIGVCAFMMLANGDKPFEGKTPKQVVAKVLIGDVRFDGPLWDVISEPAKDFIKKLLRVDPEERLTANQAIYDPWFTSEAVAASESPSCRQDLIERVQRGIVDYADTGEFRKLALNVIAKKSTSEEIFELRKVFDEFDTLHSGTITLGEFKAALVRFNYSDDEIEAIFRKVDVNHTNVINYTEFLAATIETQGAIAEHRLLECFNQMDSDESGYISRENLRDLVGSAGTEEFIDKLMAEADIKKDGRISYEEFLHVLSTERQRKVSKMYDVSEQLSVVSEEDVVEATNEVLRQHGLLGTRIDELGPFK